MNDIEVIIKALWKELEFLEENYDVPVGSLDKLVGSLSELLGIGEQEVTTPFSDDLGTENDYCYPRELGEVEDIFNVVISSGEGNPITLTRRVIRSSQDDGSYLQSMIDVLSRLKNDL